MEEMELFHIHANNQFDKKWEINNIINVDKNFECTMSRRQNNFNALINLGGEAIPLYMALNEFLYYINDAKIIKRDDLEYVKELLKASAITSFNASFFRRETALENCRKDNYSNLPSRLHSMYMCDKDGLEYWTDIIKRDNRGTIDVYRVLVNGNIFKSNEDLLPNELIDYSDSYSQSFKYWNPKFKNVEKEKNEYLVQGEVKILERVR